MDNLSFVCPDEQWEEAVMEYRREFLDAGDSMDGTACLAAAESYADWLRALRDNMDSATVREGLVPATSYLGVRRSDGRLVGMLQIRHTLNEYLAQFGGHIGYSVRKSERRKGYATQMLRLGLEECRRLGLSRVLITCDRTNQASARTILANGGKLENEVPEGEGVTQRYWIEV